MSLVRLIGVTRPVDGVADSTQALLAYCARVSSAANQASHATGPRLIRSLIRRREWSPLEMVSLTMEVSTTRDIARQILRHRSFSFQEFSQRYAEVSGPLALREARLKHPTDRQGSIETADEMLALGWMSHQFSVRRAAQRAYAWALENGIALEQARCVLPEGLTPSRLYMAGTLRSWVHYCALRTTPGAQKEHREIALAAFAVLTAEFPVLKEVELG